MLDGLERVLIAYHRYDAAQMTDEEADEAAQGEEKDPNLCIRPDDDDLLRYLAGVRSSKLLISTRNMPSALRLIGQGGVLRAGVAHLQLTGLADDDAERMMREAGVYGDGAEMRDYLERNFGNHPLMIGIVAGLVKDHLPALGDFDHWRADPDGAGALDLAALDGLVNKRNHVLKVAFEKLEPDAQKLLGRLSFFSSAVPYATLVALNPALPPRPEEVEKPSNFILGLDIDHHLQLLQEADPEKRKALEEEQKQERQKKFDEAQAAYSAYLAALEAWENAPERREAERWLRRTLLLLQRRGLVIREAAAASYDLHPLVRGFTRAGLSAADRAKTGTDIADYARAQAPRSISRESNGADLDAYFEVARLLLLGGQITQAADMLAVGADAAVARTGRGRAHFELLAQLFEPGFTAANPEVPERNIGILANQAGRAAGSLGRHEDQNAADRLNLQRHLADRDSLVALNTSLDNLARSEMSLGRIAAGKRLSDLATSVTDVAGDEAKAGHAYMRCVFNLKRGDLDWQRYAPLATLDDPEAFKGPAYVKPWLVDLKIEFDRRAGTLTEEAVAAALAQEAVSSNVGLHCNILAEQARLLQSQGADTRAQDAFVAAIRMGREQDRPVDKLEAEYAVTLARLGETHKAREEATRLSQLRKPPHLRLAKLWLALGDTEKARDEALLAYPKAWADGPPNAFHWALKDCRAVLAAVGEPEPQLPTVRPEDLPPFDFEAEVWERIEEEKAKQRDTPEKPKKAGSWRFWRRTNDGGSD